MPETDETGATDITGSIGDLEETTLPLKAVITASIHEPGGRTTDKTVDIPVRSNDVAIGIRPDFDGNSVSENAPAHFEVLALNGDGKRIALNGATYTWVREVTSYQWYQDNGEWKYQSVTRDRLMTSGTLNIGTGLPAKLGQAFPWGDYRLTVTDPKSGADHHTASTQVGRRVRPATGRTVFRSPQTDRPTNLARSRTSRSNRHPMVRHSWWWPVTKCSRRN